MKLGKFIKALFVVLAVLFVAAVALAYVLTQRVEGVLRTEMASRLPALARSLGVSIEYDDVSLCPITGLSLKGVTVSTIEDGAPSEILTAESVGLMHSLHLFPAFHVRIDGVRLNRPHLSVPLACDDPAGLSSFLPSDGDGGAAVSGRGLREMAGRLIAGAGLPVQLADELELVWRGGGLNISEGRVRLDEVTGSLALDGRGGRATLVSGARFEGDRGKVDVKAVRDAGGFDVALRAEDVKLGAFKRCLPEFVAAPDDAAASLKLIAESGERAVLWNADFGLGLKGLALNHWRLADRTIGGIDLALSGKLRVDAASRSVEFERLRIGTDGLFLNASGCAEFAQGFKLDTTIRSGRMPIQKALDAIPASFVPALEGAQVAGTIDIGLAFAVDTENLGALKFEPEIQIEGFELVKAPDGVDIERLKRPFTHKAKKKGEVVKEFLVGHPNYWFVPYKRLGEHTIKGVLTCEDGSFFRHEGFRAKHFRESLIQDLRERRFARGASTITMQTAKNLFLTGKKNLSRKFQEILIAYAMEQLLSKERILEIYMNIIEWGPEIYGIGAASKHYFDKWPKDLDPLEAAYMGSIIPTASRSYYMYKQGGVPDSWATYLALIVSKMGVVGDDYDALDPFQPEFGWVRKKREAREKLEEEEGKGEEEGK